LQKQIERQPVIVSHRPRSESHDNENLDITFDPFNSSCLDPLVAATDNVNVDLVYSTSTLGDSELARSDFIVSKTGIGNTIADSTLDFVYGSLTGSHITPISNANYSQQELHYLRRSVFTWSSQPFAVHGMALKHLWDTYGFDLSHGSDTLRLAVMAFSVGYSSLRTRFLHTEFIEYIARCHQSLVRDMDINNINETHLFAIHFLVECCDIYHAVVGQPTGRYDMYRRKFCFALEYLISRGRMQGENYPLQYLWRYLLSHRRRIYGWHFDDPPCPDSEEQVYWMHSLDMSLAIQSAGPCNKTSSRYYPEVGEDNAYLHYYWDVLDMIQSLRASFKRSYGKPFNPSTSSETESFDSLTDSAFYRTNEFSRFQYLEQKYMVIAISITCL
jgi:hypothetical protein